jgi:lactate permease
MWVQNYDPLRAIAASGPEFVLSAIVAGIPLYLLFFMLAVKRTPGHKAAMVELLRL